MRLRLWSLSLLVLLLALAPPTGAQTTGPGGAVPATRNVRGIHTLAATRDAIDAQLRWAERLVGAGGHVTQPFLGINRATPGPSADAVYFVEQAYTRQLDPILVLQSRYVNRDGCNPSGYVGWLKPEPDDGGLTYHAEAEAYRRFVAGLPRTDGRALYVQVGNEPNLHEMWGGAASPAEYARFFADVAAAIRSLGDARIVVLNAALAPEGDVDNLQFIAEAAVADRRFLSSFDLWASHPYPRNQPPAHNLHDGTAGPDSRYAIDAYLLELDALARLGMATDGLQVVLTETGYELGDAYYGEYPPVSEELRAEYIQQAIEMYWPRWPEVRAVTPFQLAGWYGSWRTFDWVWPSSRTTAHGFPTRPRLQYARLVPGIGVVTGRVHDDGGAPLADVTIRAEPGGFLAESLPDGSFVLMVYPGRYTLTAEKRGYDPARLGGIAVDEGETRQAALVLPARLPPTLQNSSFEHPALESWTPWGAVDGPRAGPWFFDVAARDGGRFLGTAVNCGAKDGGVQQSIATRPGRVVAARAWTLTYRDGAAGIRNRIGIDPTGGTDRTSARVVWSTWVETGGRWGTVSVATRAAADRVTVFLEHDQDAANPWNVSAFDGVEVVQVP